jgi:hypothetical protein
MQGVLVLILIALLFLACLSFYFVNLIEKKEEEKWKSLDTEKIMKDY